MTASGKVLHIKLITDWRKRGVSKYKNVSFKSSSKPRENRTKQRNSKKKKEKKKKKCKALLKSVFIYNFVTIALTQTEINKT